MTSAPAPDPAFATAFREQFGRCATRFAQLGHDTMRDLIALIGRLGDRARQRPVLAAEWLRTQRPPAAFEVVRDDGCR